MSGWAQREAERKEDEANEMDDLITEVRELRAELAAAKEAIEDIERTLEIAEIPKYGSIGDRIPWNERVELLSDDRDALCADNARLRKALETRSRAAEGGGVGMDQDRLIEDVKRTAEYFRAEAAELRRRVAALERELVEARKDGARLDHLIDRKLLSCDVFEDAAEMCIKAGCEDPDNDRRWVRAAIDRSEEEGRC